MSPMAPKRPCPGKGPRTRRCPNIVARGVSCCPACAPYEKATVREYDHRRGNAKERGYDATWAKVRAMKLSADPLCEEHLRQGHVVPAVLVHHIQPVETHPEMRLSMENLRSLCVEHHEAIHKGERWGRQG